MSDPVEPATDATRKRRKWDVADPALAGLGVPAPVAPGPVGAIPPMNFIPQMAPLQPTPPTAPLDEEAAAAAAQARAEELSSRLLASRAASRPSAVNPSDKHTAEVGINHCRADIRQHLTKTTTHEEIHRETGATITTKGVYVAVGDIPAPDQKPLFLLIEADSNEAIEAARHRILQMSKSQSPLTSNGILVGRIPIGLEHAEPGFSVIGKILGPQGSFVKYIESKTKTRVQLRGRGSGKRDSEQYRDEELHLFVQAQDGKALEDAQKLAQELVDNVKKEYATWQEKSRTVQAPPPPSGPPPPQYGQSYPAQQYGQPPPPPGPAPGSQPPPPPGGYQGHQQRYQGGYNNQQQANYYGQQQQQQQQQYQQQQQQQQQQYQQQQYGAPANGQYGGYPGYDYAAYYQQYYQYYGQYPQGPMMGPAAPQPEQPLQPAASGQPPAPQEAPAPRRFQEHKEDDKKRDREGDDADGSSKKRKIDDDAPAPGELVSYDTRMEDPADKAGNGPVRTATNFWQAPHGGAPVLSQHGNGRVTSPLVDQGIDATEEAMLRQFRSK